MLSPGAFVPFAPEQICFDRCWFQLDKEFCSWKVNTWKSPIWFNAGSDI